MAESLKIVWDDSLLTGSRAIDVQHKFLIDIINDLAEAIEEGKGAAAVGKILNLIRYYSEWHFEREEDCMLRHECPVADANKDAHAYFLETFAGFQAEFRASGGSDEIARRMYTELTQWLVNHIKGVDCHIAACLPGEPEETN